MTRLLVVGGFDPSGAGVDADRAALEGLGVDALVVVTARTKQDDHAVHAIGAVDADAWLAEALAHVERGVDAIKFGLLPGAQHVHAATQLARAARLRRPGIVIVLDPVIAASSGSRFLDTDAVELMRGELLGEDVIVTPNLAEAAELAQISAARLARSSSAQSSSAQSFAARLDCAQFLIGLGARAVIVKGGHGLEDPVRDLVIERDRDPVHIEHARIPGGKIRGSGCRYATRLAARMAQSWTLETAAKDASEHVSAAIARACRR